MKSAYQAQIAAFCNNVLARMGPPANESLDEAIEVAREQAQDTMGTYTLRQAEKAARKLVQGS